MVFGRIKTSVNRKIEIMSNQARTILRVTLVVVLILLQVLSYSATRVSKQNGDWDAASTWVGGVVPNCGDSVAILGTHTVDIANHEDYSGCGTRLTIAVYGTLKFANGKKMQLSCGSYLYVYTGGKVSPGGGGGNSNYIEICNVSVWKAADGNYLGSGCLGCSLFLPIELVDFTVKNNTNSIDINWSTASELNTERFLIERSVDGSKWETVASVNANGTNNTLISYKSSDEKPVNGISYYRLKTVDKDQSSAYSKIESIERNAKDVFSIFPNPSKGIITINFSKEAKDLSYRVIDVTGKVIREAIKENLESKMTLDLSGLDKGLYFIDMAFSNGDQYNNNKLIIE